MSLNVDSEIGRLRRVLVHRPGREIDRMVPSMMSQLLFDDILDGDEAREEHDVFCRIMQSAGVATLDAQSLLGEVLAAEEPRARLLDELGREYGVPRAMVERLAGLPPVDLAAALVEGVLARDDGEAVRQRFYDLQPVPNYFFQRDPQVVLGDRVVISSMATDAREREPLLARAIFGHHPALAGYRALFEIDVPPSGAPQHDPSYPYPTLEGGTCSSPAPRSCSWGSASARTATASRCSPSTCGWRRRRSGT